MPSDPFALPAKIARLRRELDLADQQTRWRHIALLNNEAAMLPDGEEKQALQSLVSMFSAPEQK